MGNVARMGDKRNTYRVLVGGHLKEREQLGDLEVNERVILKCILKKEDGRTRIGHIWLRQGQLTVCS